MGLTAEWFDEEKSIILYRFVGSWTWNELYRLIQEANAMTAAVSHDVYTIVDFSKTGAIPLGALTHMRSATLHAPENWRGAVFVGTSAFVNTLLTTFGRISPQLAERYQIAKTVEEAHAIVMAKQKIRDING